MHDQYLQQQKQEREHKLQIQKQYQEELEAIKNIRDKMKREQTEKERMQEAVEV
jgi:hypothetical protein